MLELLLVLQLAPGVQSAYDTDGEERLDLQVSGRVSDCVGVRVTE